MNYPPTHSSLPTTSAITTINRKIIWLSITLSLSYHRNFSNNNQCTQRNPNESIELRQINSYWLNWPYKKFVFIKKKKKTHIQNKKYWLGFRHSWLVCFDRRGELHIHRPRKKSEKSFSRGNRPVCVVWRKIQFIAYLLLTSMYF